MCLFSVIVPIYNVEKYLKTCVDSIINQSFKDIEIILVDDGSTDNSPAICDNYKENDSRITVIHQSNKGLSGARNTGVKAASGEFLIFIDSDDFYADTDFFKRLSDIIRAEPELDMINYKFVNYNQEKNIYYPSYYTFASVIDENASYVENITDLIKTGNLTISACMRTIRREFFVKNDLFFKQGIVSEDIEWAMRLYPAISKTKFIDDSSYAYRKNRPGSISSSIKIKNVMDLYDIVNEYSKIFLNSDNPIHKALLNYLTYQYSILCGLLVHLPKSSEKKEITQKIKQMKWLFEYRENAKVKKVYKIYSLFGITLTVKILGLYIKYR